MKIITDTKTVFYTKAFILYLFFFPSLLWAAVPEHATLTYNDYPSACLNCHSEEYTEMFHSTHYKWQGGGAVYGQPAGHPTGKAERGEFLLYQYPGKLGRLRYLPCRPGRKAGYARCINGKY